MRCKVVLATFATNASRFCSQMVARHWGSKQAGVLRENEELLYKLDHDQANLLGSVATKQTDSVVLGKTCIRQYY